MLMCHGCLAHNICARQCAVEAGTCAALKKILTTHSLMGLQGNAVGLQSTQTQFF
jgi:hypothetical protein